MVLEERIKIKINSFLRILLESIIIMLEEYNIRVIWETSGLL